MGEVNLEKLDCHYNWNLFDGDVTEEKCGNLFDYLKTDSIMNPDVEIPSLLFVSFLCDQLKNDVKQALESIDEAIIKSKEHENEKHAIGYEYVALANKIHLLVKNTGTEERDILDLHQEIKKLELCSSSKANIYGTRGYALSLMGKNKYPEGLSFYQKAFRLERNYFVWPMGIAILNGRLRRMHEGAHSYPTEIEEECLELSIRLSENKKALPIVLMADVYFTKGRELAQQSKDDNWLNLAEKFYLRAVEIAPECSHVLKRSGKAFSVMDKLDLAEKFLLKGVEVNPVDSVCLHRLGQLYDHKKRDWRKAREYYERAVKVRCGRNLFAEMDLARINKKLDRNFDVLQQFKHMKSLYENDEWSILKIDEAILKQVEYEENSRKREQFGRNENYTNNNHLEINRRRSESSSRNERNYNGHLTIENDRRSNSCFRNPNSNFSSYQSSVNIGRRSTSRFHNAENNGIRRNSSLTNVRNNGIRRNFSLTNGENSGIRGVSSLINIENNELRRNSILTNAGNNDCIFMTSLQKY